MNLKAAVCPNCGGRMQLSDNLSRVRCEYCGANVIVEDAIRFVQRVKEFTEATPIEKKQEDKPFDVSAARRQTNLILIAAGSLGFLVAVLVVNSDPVFGISLGIATAFILPLIYFVRTRSLDAIKAADELMMKKGSSVEIVGYECSCPYCETKVTIHGYSAGADCKACKKRIVIRDSRFYSVSTPISGS